MRRIPLISTTWHRGLVLIIAAAAIFCLSQGLPEYLDQVAAANGQPVPTPGWITAASILALPNWCWMAYSTIVRKQWGWLISATMLSHLGTIGYAIFGDHFSTQKITQ